MGLDIHSFNFLKYARSKGEFRDTVMLGRQENHLPSRFINEIVGGQSKHDTDRYSEWIFRDIFSADTISSLDNSDYEGATHLADMSKELPESLKERFDTVFDGGVLEHIYDAPQALKNISSLCRVGGQIIHILPANNFCGHGFWQFSPELFFSLYSERNGYRETEVFLAHLKDIKTWYRVKKPTSGRRTCSLSSEPIYVLVRTVIHEKDFSHSDVQQSDYVHAWTKSGDASAPEDASQIKMKKPISQKLRGVFFPKKLRRRQEKSLTKWNPCLEPVEVSEFKLGYLGSGA